MHSKATHYPIFLVGFLSARGDHHAIYVETSTESGDKGRGDLFHVVGSLQAGIVYEHRVDTHSPVASLSFTFLKQIGCVSHENLGQVNSICETITPPEKQWELTRRLVPEEEIRHCQHWAAEVAHTLREQSVLEECTECKELDWVRDDESNVVRVEPGRETGVTWGDTASLRRHMKTREVRLNPSHLSVLSLVDKPCEPMPHTKVLSIVRIKDAGYRQAPVVLRVPPLSERPHNTSEELPVRRIPT